MPFAQALLSDPSVPISERQQALNRIFSDPGIPDIVTTSSFWLQNPHPHFTHRASSSLPTEAEIVIIGSGITGASIARTLLQSRIQDASSPSPHPTVVMLEARDICSGATGRNGGHIIETADIYADLADGFGEETARKILRFRLAHLSEMLGVADELGLTAETQARKVKFLSVYFGDGPWKAALERLRLFKEGMPVEAAEWMAYEGESIPQVCVDYPQHERNKYANSSSGRISIFPTRKVSFLVLQAPCGPTSS